MFSNISTKASCFVFVLMVLMLAAGAAFAQIAQPDNNVERAAPQLTSTVTASATAERVRFTAPSNITSMRIEVFNENAEKVFDSNVHAGNLFDWQLQGGQSLSDGNYLCVVTVQSISARVSRKLGTVSVAHQQLLLRPASGSQLAPMQKQTLAAAQPDGETTELIEPLIIIDPNQPVALTAIAHDGNEGQVIRSKGALSFRVGNFFSGNDLEQMRLTEEGNLGIGTSEPKATLDVAGTIRAERFLIAKPKLAKGDKAATNAQTTDAVDSVQPLIAGTGTLNHIAKWTPDGSTLGDSMIFEDGSNNVGIRTATPTQALDVLNGRIVATGSQTLTSVLDSVIEVKTTVTNSADYSTAFKARNLFNGAGNGPTGMDVAPTFAPAGNIALARGFVSAAFFAPPPGVTITDALGGHGANVYSNTSGAVTNGTTFLIESPFVLGALKPTTQYGVRIKNQGIGGTTNSYGLYVDAQSGSTNNYAAIFAGGNVGIGYNTAPTAKLDVTGNINTTTQYNINGNRVLSTDGENLFAGNGAGEANMAGRKNSFFGSGAGRNNLDGSFNSFFGWNAGLISNGSNNTFLGAFSDGAAATTNSTAIGSNAKFTQSNSLVLGSINTVNGATADTKVGIGTTAPSATLTVVAFSNNGTENTATFRAANIGPNQSHIHYGTTGDWFIRSAASTGKVILQDTGGNVGIGMTAPAYPLTILGSAGAGQNQGVLDVSAPASVPDAGIRLSNGAASGRTYTLFSSGGSTGIGAGNFTVFDATANAFRLSITSTGNVGVGTTGPSSKLQVSGGDAAISTQGNGLILRATDGANCFRVTVNNAGALSTAAVTCP